MKYMYDLQLEKISRKFIQHNTFPNYKKIYKNNSTFIILDYKCEI